MPTPVPGKLTKQLDEVKRSYIEAIGRRKYESDAVKAEKIAILDALARTEFDESPPTRTEQVEAKIKLIDAIKFQSSTNLSGGDIGAAIAANLSSIALGTGTTTQFKFRKSNFFMKFLSLLKDFFRQHPEQHFDDVLKDLRGLLVELKKNLNTTQYSSEQIAASPNLIAVTPPLTAEQLSGQEKDTAAAMVDFARSAKLDGIGYPKPDSPDEDYTKEMMGRISEFAANSKGVRDPLMAAKISQTSGQSLAAPMLAELYRAIPDLNNGKYTQAATHIGNMNWTKDEEGEVYYDLHYCITAILNNENGETYIQDPNTGELVEFSDVRLGELKQNSAKYPPVIEVIIRIHFDKSVPNQITPKVVSYTTINNHPKILPSRPEGTAPPAEQNPSAPNASGNTEGVVATPTPTTGSERDRAPIAEAEAQAVPAPRMPSLSMRSEQPDEPPATATDSTPPPP